MKIELKNKKTTIFNSEAMVSVEIVDKKRCNHLNYQLFKKSFWGNRESGFYTDMGNHPFTKEELETGKLHGISFLVEDNIVYYYPYVRTLFVGGDGEMKVFKTYKEAMEYGKSVADKGIKFQFNVED